MNTRESLLKLQKAKAELNKQEARILSKLRSEKLEELLRLLEEMKSLNLTDVFQTPKVQRYFGSTAESGGRAVKINVDKGVAKQVLNALKKGELSVAQILKASKAKLPSVSITLKNLNKAGYIKKVRRGVYKLVGE